MHVTHIHPTIPTYMINSSTTPFFTGDVSIRNVRLKSGKNQEAFKKRRQPELLSNNLEIYFYKKIFHGNKMKKHQLHTSLDISTMAKLKGTLVMLSLTENVQRHDLSKLLRIMHKILKIIVKRFVILIPPVN